jgi:hypothetical protein
MAKKKMNYTPYILGVGALAAVGFIFKDDIKKLFKKNEDLEPVIDENLNTSPGIGSGVKNEPNRGGGGGGISMVGITPGLSGMGTPKDRLNLNQILKKGDRGQEVAKLQQILSRAAKLYKLATISEDGVFGQGTEGKLSQIYGAPTINLFKAYAMLFAIWNAQNNNDSKNWYKKYFEPYLTDAERYRKAREFYFNKNEIL